MPVLYAVLQGGVRADAGGHSGYGPYHVASPSFRSGPGRRDGLGSWVLPRALRVQTFHPQQPGSSQPLYTPGEAPLRTISIVLVQPHWGHLHGEVTAECDPTAVGWHSLAWLHPQGPRTLMAFCVSSIIPVVTHPPATATYGAQDPHIASSPHGQEVIRV